MSGLLLLIAAAGGTLSTYLYDDEAHPVTRVCAGTCLGAATLALVGFALASLLGLRSLTLSLAGAAVALPVLVLLRPQYRLQVRADLARVAGDARRCLRPTGPRAIAAGLLCLLALGAIWRVLGRAAFLRDGAWYTGTDHNVGDLPFHVALIQSFAVGDNYPPEHPELAGVRLTYPFLVDFLAAMLVRCGSDLHRVLAVQSFLLTLALVGLLFRWARVLTGSSDVGLLVPALVLLSGGLGWLHLFGDVRDAPGGLLELLLRLPHDYTIRFQGGLRWGNAVVTLLLPQRAWLLGLPLSLVAWTLWWQALSDEPGSTGEGRRMLAAGVAAGLLPLSHSHSFAVLLGMGACLALLFPRRSWLGFFATAGLIASPQVVWMAAGHSLRTGGFVGWHIGWEAGDEGPLAFWLWNAGLFIPLLLIAIAWRRGGPVDARLLRFYLPFALCFLVPNLLRLSPWIWDNVKFLFYWYVASTPLVALLLVRLARGTLGRLVSGALFVCLTLAGGLDVWRVASGAVERSVFDREGVAFARFVEHRTPRGARLLTAPVHNHPVFLAGRRTVLGYDGHLWSQGLEYADRAQAVPRIYAGGPTALDLARRLGVDFAVLGPPERRAFEVDEVHFERSYSEVGSVGPYRLFRMRR